MRKTKSSLGRALLYSPHRKTGNRYRGTDAARRTGILYRSRNQRTPGVLDASEIPPTFGMPDTYIIGIIAGGETALRHPVENAEDDTLKGWEELQAFHISDKDTVIGIAASGTTPYVIGALQQARKRGILTAGISSNPDSPSHTQWIFPSK